MKAGMMMMMMTAASEEDEDGNAGRTERAEAGIYHAAAIPAESEERRDRREPAVPSTDGHSSRRALDAGFPSERSSGEEDEDRRKVSAFLL